MQPVTYIIYVWQGLAVFASGLLKPMNSDSHKKRKIHVVSANNVKYVPVHNSSIPVFSGLSAPVKYYNSMRSGYNSHLWGGNGPA